MSQASPVHPFRQRYQLRDVWNAILTERDFNTVFWTHIAMDILVERGMHFFGFVLVMIASMIIIFLGTGGFLVVLPNIAEFGSFQFFFFGIFGKIFFCELFDI